MEDKLITLAIHTFEKAQILKTILETEGIDVYIHNVNQIQPVVSAGVRVRIKESDLPHALRIIEDNKLFAPPPKESSSEERKVLIPIDFSDYSLKACELGLNYAYSKGLKAVIMHAYFTPYFPTGIPMPSSLSNKADQELEISIQERIKTDMGKIDLTIREKMQSGELHKVEYESLIREGLPEEEINTYCKEHHPKLVIMGTRGKNQKEMDLIGSVTGEVLDICQTPVMAIPENIAYKDLSEMKHVAFATSFNQRDLVAFDGFMELMEGYDVQIHLFNVSTSRNEWNGIRLAGVKEYFKKQYPKANISYTTLDDGDLLLAVEKFVRDKQIDMIALSTFRRNLLSRMFIPGLARKMLFHTDTPLLVIHS